MGTVRILVFGNPLVAEDSIALKILPLLRKRFPTIAFVEFDAVEDLEKEGSDLTILDAVEGIEKVSVLTDIDSFENTKRFSMHDFDLGQSLKLLKAMGLLKTVNIIGIPMTYPAKKAFSEIVPVIEAMERA
ncbi:MAG: hypothetical protein J4215_03900 [Candidatus Diapherotrites archaeon]|uniref:Hydrogenase maturation protease n=1 Tax=Candidatus Iainarchaeum sp. TaxID=3101447 RepID=A0A8T4L852_9ARCH|nr:hypothetical protein [Candidatus Diapherotrites archaeon]